MKDYKNILIIKMSSLGDVIHALPTLYAVRKNWPNARITWAIHEQFASLLPGTPWVDDVIIIDKKRLKKPAYLYQLRKAPLYLYYLVHLKSMATGSFAKEVI